MTNRTPPRLIAMDWGTTSCRAYLLGEEGVVIAERHDASGVMPVTARATAAGSDKDLAFDQTFEALCGDWLQDSPDLPVIASGMVGSNHGWAEAPYRQVPADLAEVGAALTPARTRAGATVQIIPGLMVKSTLPGVMRGEETQILGALLRELGAGRHTLATDRIIVLPGTHSKWVRLTGTTVTDFTTCVTGEIYALLTRDSTLSRLARRAAAPDWGAFARGLDVAAGPIGRAGILHTAFSARTLVMVGELAPGQVEDYLSGLLIGHEVAGLAPSWTPTGPEPILLCGDPLLNDRYRRALVARGVRVEVAEPQSAPVGMWHVAVGAGLLKVPTSSRS